MVGRTLRQYYNPDNTTLIVEPGNALVAATVDFVTTVLDVKVTDKSTFINTDGSRTQIDPLMTKSAYFYEVKYTGKQGRRIVNRQIITGFTCMEHDRLFEIQEGEELQPGDQIVYHKVGAYTMCLSPLFIKWYPDVYVRDGEAIKIVRKRWTESDYKIGSIVE